MIEDNCIRMMYEIFDKISEHLSSKREYITLFSKYDTREEWWVRGELIWLFSKLGVSFEMEVKLETDWIDFVLWIENKSNLLELKTISTAGSRRLSFYFTKNQLLKDFDRLSKKQEKYKWELVIVYPCQIAQWQQQTERVQRNCAGVQCVRTRDFVLEGDKKCLISLWQVK